jgi:hypothetical protein
MEEKKGIVEKARLGPVFSASGNNYGGAVRGYGQKPAFGGGLLNKANGMFGKFSTDNFRIGLNGKGISKSIGRDHQNVDSYGRQA